MKPEEMRDDIPMDVREALAAIVRDLPCAPDSVLGQIKSALRAKPRTVKLPAADLPAPLEEVPEDGQVWCLDSTYPGALIFWPATHRHSLQAVYNGLAFATREEAEAWLTHLQSWRIPRPGDDWTPHTPGDPIPCDGEAIVQYQMRDGTTSRRPEKAKALDWRSLLGAEWEIIAWRYYAREGEA
jgi:hypothetical protein